jgi:hypothetical protein
LTSPDGITWSKQVSSAGVDLWTAYATKSEVILGGDDGKLLISSDSQTWEAATGPTPGAIFGMAGSPTTIVAVTTSGARGRSTDGRTWTIQNAGKRYEDLIWTGSKFVALGTNFVDESPDGVTWTRHSVPVPGGLQALAFDGERVYVVGFAGRVLQSVDLVRWSQDTCGFERGGWPASYSMWFETILYDKQGLFAAGSDGIVIERR